MCLLPGSYSWKTSPSSRIHGEDESLHLGDWRKLITSLAYLLAELAEATPEPRSLRDLLGAEVPQCGADLLRGGFE